MLPHRVELSSIRRTSPQRPWCLAALFDPDGAGAEWPLSLFTSGGASAATLPGRQACLARSSEQHLLGQRRYGVAVTAAFVCREEARWGGNRRSLLGQRWSSFGGSLQLPGAHFWTSDRQ